METILWNEDRYDEGEEDIYKEANRETMVDDDTLSAAEDGFMQGYDGADAL